MSSEYRCDGGTYEFMRAVWGLSLKHALGLWLLDDLGYDPIWKDRNGKVHVLGRTTTYAALTDEMYSWNAKENEWKYDLPF